jgi:GNAT superfamily N-acetyltransferase
MNRQESVIQYRPLAATDVETVPLLHQGTPEEVRARIAAIGSSAILAFEEGAHVGQIQFRPYEPGVVSPNGLHDPLYWMDFEDQAPTMPDRSLTLFCYHVGQLDNTDRRDPRYMGRGIGTRLLDETIAWAKKAGFSAIIAKGLSSLRPIPQVMGGMPTELYLRRQFKIAASYYDQQLLEWIPGMINKTGQEENISTNYKDTARIDICVKTLSHR